MYWMFLPQQSIAQRSVWDRLPIPSTGLSAISRQRTCLPTPTMCGTTALYFISSQRLNSASPTSGKLEERSDPGDTYWSVHLVLRAPQNAADSKLYDMTRSRFTRSSVYDFNFWRV